MCGLYGIYSAQGDVDREAIKACRDKLAHRGPDDSGLWCASDGRIGLAHRRLAVVDLSPAGHQPMLTPDERYAIVFNGEIYNYRALRRKLEVLGVGFSGDSDTEVLLQAFRVWGKSCLSRLNGMFSFVIYDQGDEGVLPSLFFARDRVGKKPFYYVSKPGFFEFSSELKALSSPGTLSLSALNFYLSLGYIPGDLCIADAVKKLPPGHYGQLGLDTGKLEISSYWSLPENRQEDINDQNILVDEVERLLLDSTRLRLHADVPIGVLLSGGLDSSLVTAAAAKVSTGTIKTFSISVPGSELDESARARLIARHFSTEHYELPLNHQGIEALDDIAPFVDEPLADSSLIPSYLVSKLTKGAVTVALGGDGGDELFGGYNDYFQSLADHRRFGWIPPAALAWVARSAAQLPAGVRGRNRLGSLRQGPYQQMIWGRPYFDSVLRQRIMSPQAYEALNDTLESPERFLKRLYKKGNDPVDSMTRTHFGSILPDDFMFKVDRASMMVSLEMRAPLLDHRLVEFAFGRIPSDCKVTNSGSRFIQRLLARRWLPAGIENAQKKGFSIPMDAWLRKVDDRWHHAWIDRLPGVIDRDAAMGLLKGLKSGRSNGARIFALVMLGWSVENLGFSS